MTEKRYDPRPVRSIVCKLRSDGQRVPTEDRIAAYNAEQDRRMIAADLAWMDRGISDTMAETTPKGQRRKNASS